MLVPALRLASLAIISAKEAGSAGAVLAPSSRCIFSSSSEESLSSGLTIFEMIAVGGG